MLQQTTLTVAVGSSLTRHDKENCGTWYSLDNKMMERKSKY